MESQNKAEIQRAFSQQAQNFESGKMNFTNREYLDYAVSKIAPKASDIVLEAAAGTCACGRAVARYAKSVVCLDMTPEMLAVGRAKAEEEKLGNMTFVLGDSAELPFLDGSFDIVFSRLAFHHFPDAEQPFSEMVRVLKHGGKLVLVDMEAAEPNLRQTEDDIEKLRDNSHIRNLSKAEMLGLFENHGLSVECCETTKMPIKLANWLEHTSASKAVQAEIISRMEEDIHGGAKTGFYPYMNGSDIYFDHRWVLVSGVKG